MILFMFLLQVSVQCLAQEFKGRITDKSGQPVQYATVYIQEIRQGTTSNTRGDYEIRLPPGKYTVFYQSLGYEPLVMNIEMTGETLIRDVTLSEQFYEIPEVRITASGEDPAYLIMRKAIGLAPYYLNQVSYYKAEVYLKGNLLIKKIPRLLQKTMRMNNSDRNASVSAGGKPEEKSVPFREGDSFLMESYNEVEFNAPDKYVQRVISYNSTFPDQGDGISPMDYIQASFYQPVLADMAISPLSPQAFSHYDFRYLGSSPQGNYTINKIEVIPRRKSQQLFSGTIYIVENLWCLHSVDLTNENIAGRIRVRELYIPVEEDIWMPVSHQIDINLAILGIRADAGYASSVKYEEVKPNTSLQKPPEISLDIAGKTSVEEDTVKSKTTVEIEKILQKEEMTNRDMIKLSRLMEKESKKSLNDTTKNSLEVKDNTVQIIEKDAGKRDSAYWAEIRPIPLSETDIRSLRVSDSLRKATRVSEGSVPDSLQAAKPKGGRFRQSFNNIVFGHTWSDTTGFSFNSGGLINARKLSFNTVDGFVYGTDFRISKTMSRHRMLAFYPDIRYAFSRQRLMVVGNLNYSVAGMKPARFFINSGITSREINSAGGINQFLNSISSLFFRRNYLKLYESRYITAGIGKEIANGINIEMSLGYEYRHVLENSTDFSFVRSSRDYTDNIPDNIYLIPGANLVNQLSDQNHLEFVTNVTITPMQKYRVSNGNKMAMGSDWPVIKFTWKHGINQLADAGTYRHFDMFRADISRRRDMAAFSEVRWNVATGVFADNRYLPYYDFFHFNSQPVPVLLNDYDNAFMLPPFYSLSTPEFFGELHFRYTAPYILLKLLPGLSNTLIRENLSLSYLGTRFRKSYTEIGYSLSEIFLVGEAGIFAGFNNLTYSNLGIRFVFRFN